MKRRKKNKARQEAMKARFRARILGTAKPEWTVRSMDSDDIGFVNSVEDMLSRFDCPMYVMDMKLLRSEDTVCLIGRRVTLLVGSKKWMYFNANNENNKCTVVSPLEFPGGLPRDVDSIMDLVTDAVSERCRCGCASVVFGTELVPESIVWPAGTPCCEEACPCYPPAPTE